MAWAHHHVNEGLRSINTFCAPLLPRDLLSEARLFWGWGQLCHTGFSSLREHVQPLDFASSSPQVFTTSEMLFMAMFSQQLSCRGQCKPKTMSVYFCPSCMVDQTASAGKQALPPHTVCQGAGARAAASTPLTFYLFIHCLRHTWSPPAPQGPRQGLWGFDTSSSTTTHHSPTCNRPFHCCAPVHGWTAWYLLLSWNRSWGFTDDRHKS